LRDRQEIYQGMIVMADLSHLRVAVLATDGFEEAELTEPVKALQAAGARVDILSNKTGEIQAFQHHEKSTTVSVDRLLDEAQPDEYDAVLLPGGALNTDTLRAEPNVKTFLQQMQEAGKPFAIICHAAWELISANLVQGRTLTSYYTIQDDVRNAGGNWIDQDVVIDQNWVTSRQPDDIPAFNQALLKVFSQFAPAISNS
jgi:protease I